MDGVLSLHAAKLALRALSMRNLVSWDSRQQYRESLSKERNLQDSLSGFMSTT